jgi:Cd2+/Zn2+-exporting ATPase/Cu+-exporting ATPase
MKSERVVEIPITGMDCTECTRHVQQSISALPGVQAVEVLLAAEKAVVRIDPERIDLAAIQKAVKDAGYDVGRRQTEPVGDPSRVRDFSRRIIALLGLVFGTVLFVVVVGEWLGLFAELTERVPFAVGLALVIIGGLPVFKNVLRAALKRQVTSHTLMSVGVIAALVIGEWATAAVIVLFMRVGDSVEGFTSEKARQAVKRLSAMAPQTARVVRDGAELEIPADAVVVGETVVVRPGETIPVDGTVIHGRATVDQAAITGEAMPVEVGPGDRVFAATLPQMGGLKIRSERIGIESTFGRVIRMVEQAEANRGEVQRFADRFSGYFLPVVAGIALLTFLIRHDPMATAAVLVVACSCAIALATPIAVLSSIGAAARHGLLIKGGRYIESLARADVVLIDKTGTLTLGRPQLTDIIPLGRLTETEVLRLAASAERYSEHPVAHAIRTAAADKKIALTEPSDFESQTGIGVQAVVDGIAVAVKNRRLITVSQNLSAADTLEQQGKTVLALTCNDKVAGLLAVFDTLRPEVPAAVARLRELGFEDLELLTGDNASAAAAIAAALGIRFRAELLPEDKIAVVRDYQSRGHCTVMIGDGVNDAPALAQADVGIAMGAAGADIAIEAAHVALMGDDWSLVPELFRISRRTMGVVKMNLLFTAVYNTLGLSLAALGFLPPILAAAAQSIPDLIILGNSSRLLRHKR